MKVEALALGFKHVESAPLVRSSYHARDQVPGAELKAAPPPPGDARRRRPGRPRRELSPSIGGRADAPKDVADRVDRSADHEEAFARPARSTDADRARSRRVAASTSAIRYRSVGGAPTARDRASQTSRAKASHRRPHRGRGMSIPTAIDGES